VTIRQERHFFILTIQVESLSDQTMTIRWSFAGSCENVESLWQVLIQRAWEERANPSLKALQQVDRGDFESTLDFIRYALDVSQQYENTKPSFAGLSRATD
jgi:hypothetical protein